MTLITLLFVLMLEYLFKISSILEEEFKSHNWFPRWREWISSKIKNNWFAGWSGVVIIVGIPVLLVYLLLDIDKGLIFWLFQLILSIVVIIYCLGPIDQNEHLSQYFEAIKRTDLQSAYHHVEDYLDLKSDQQIPEDTAKLGRVVTCLILSQSNFRFFGVLFYFVLTGPAGALLYRLVCHFEFATRVDENSPFRKKLRQIRDVLDWFPARLTGFLFALAGDFPGAMTKLKQHLFQADQPGELLLKETGLGALGLDSEAGEDIIEENQQALSLISRSLVILIVIIAMLTVVGWLS